MNIVIAIDGPAASGKGTLARLLAERLGVRYLDTGALYRAVARDVLLNGAAPDDEEAALAAARALDADTLGDPALREQKVGAAASQVANMPKVRAALLQFQRDFAAQPEGAVLDGRDIGTVVCPDARVKLFVTADAQTRARRRAAELREKGDDTPFDVVLREIEQRDARDRNRAASPLKPAPDAHLLNTTNLDIEGAYRAAMTYVESIMKSSGCAS